MLLFRNSQERLLNIERSLSMGQGRTLPLVRLKKLTILESLTEMFC